MASHDVFISYPSVDKVAADAVCHGLEAQGIRCWMAPRDIAPGTDWQQSLVDAISASRVVVLVFTAATNGSSHIRREIAAAIENEAVVIPFRLENVMPEGALRYQLTGVHWLDAMSGGLEDHIASLAGTVRRVLDANAPASLPEEAPVEPTPAPAPVAVTSSVTETPAAASPIEPLPVPPTAAPAAREPKRNASGPALPGWAKWAGVGAAVLLLVVVIAIFATRGGSEAPAGDTVGTEAAAPETTETAPAAAAPEAGAPADLASPPAAAGPATAGTAPPAATAAATPQAAAPQPAAARPSAIDNLMGRWRSPEGVELRFERSRMTLTFNGSTQTSGATYREQANGGVTVIDETGDTGTVEPVSADAMAFHTNGRHC